MARPSNGLPSELKFSLETNRLYIALYGFDFGEVLVFRGANTPRLHFCNILKYSLSH